MTTAVAEKSQVQIRVGTGPVFDCAVCVLSTGAEEPEMAKPSEGYEYSIQDSAYDALVAAARKRKTRPKKIAVGRKRTSIIETSCSRRGLVGPLTACQLAMKQRAARRMFGDAAVTFAHVVDLRNERGAQPARHR